MVNIIIIAAVIAIAVCWCLFVSYSKRQTSAEAIFWEIVRDRKFHGLKFRRQHQIGLNIVDFYCHEKRLVVEFDGEIHDRKQNAHFDRERDAFLRSKGLRVFRIPNDFLLSAPDQAFQDLAAFIETPSPSGRGLG